ncbi:fibrillin-1-like isoform X2 [Patiria miniata]|uniref:EGF-like domain-containing protein n=1 Tax=Patiria miniata TaxID=46514 RepID=A0A914ASD8_PATMI|nr:fibrillin-1-like isoform X2 [Patiria miniata]
MDALRCILAVVLILCVATAVESADNKCRTVYKTWGSEKYTSYYKQRYSVSCGFCGWARCTRYRQVSCDAYRRKLYTSIRNECCPGWRRDRYGRCSMAICSTYCPSSRGSCVRPNVYRCRPGYYGRTCQYDVNECQSESSNQCSQICINTVGSYRCECNTGYLLASNGRSCTDIDECSMSRTQDCHHRCVNTPGSYRCECYWGYDLNQANGKECRDNDECAGMTDSCDQLCMNVGGSYSCDCSMGYELFSGRRCRDIDECELGRPHHDCDQGCTNAVGTFNCSCADGYQLGMDGKTCLDVDECAPPMNCDMIKICDITGQKPNCSYVSGNLTDIGECDDVNACSLVDYNCTELQVCQPISQNLTCACIERDGHALTDSRGAVSGSPSTDPSLLRRCETVNGHFHCNLLQDYQLILDDTFCEDGIKHNCTEMEVCRNTVGGYECPCKAGYIMNNDTQECDDIDECSTDYMNCPEGTVQICQTNVNGTIECQCVEGTLQECGGDNCDLCEGGVRVCSDENTCTCHRQFFLNAANEPCKGGGCGEMIHDCTEMENCVNTIGGYNCTCMQGYIREDVVNGTCKDVNECHDETALCNHLCMNNVGNYSCTCVEGFMLDPDGYTCRMRMGLYEAYSALSLEEGLDEPMEMSSSMSVSSQGWLFPLGMVCGIAIIAITVVGRNKSERFRHGTDVPLNAMRSLQRRVTRSRSSGGGQSNVYMATPSREPGGGAADPMNDDAVYTPNTVGQM